MSLIVPHMKRPYALNDDQERNDFSTKKQRTKPPEKMRLKKQKRDQFDGSVLLERVSKLFPFLNSSAACFVQVNTKVYDHFINWQRCFQNPIKEVPDLLFPLLPDQDAVNLGLINKAWSQCLREQVRFDVEKKEGVAELLYFLSAFNEQQLDHPTLEDFEALDPQVQARKLITSAKKLFHYLANTPERRKEVEKAFTQAAKIWCSAFEDLSDEAKMSLDAYWLEQKGRIEKILMKASHPSLETFYEIPRQLVEFFTKMESALQNAIFMKVSFLGEWGLIRFFLNLEAQNRIAINPVVRGCALVYAILAEENDLELIKLLLRSGPIEEGGLLEQEGFNEDNESKRSVAIHCAVQGGKTEIVRTLLEDRPIRGTDPKLESALIEAVIGGEDLIVDLLLKYIRFRPAAIDEAEDAAEEDEDMLVLLSDYREQHLM